MAWNGSNWVSGSLQSCYVLHNVVWERLNSVPLGCYSSFKLSCLVAALLSLVAIPLSLRSASFQAAMLNLLLQLVNHYKSA